MDLPQGSLGNGWKSVLNFPTREEIAFAQQRLSKGHFRGWKERDESLPQDDTTTVDLDTSESNSC
eukprot:COSAG01_NODE_21597_length_894_cov_1.164780_1_plen_64_part_10